MVISRLMSYCFFCFCFCFGNEDAEKKERDALLSRCAIRQCKWFRAADFLTATMSVVGRSHRIACTIVQWKVTNSGKVTVILDCTIVGDE